MRYFLVLLIVCPAVLAQDRPACRWGLAPNTACSALEKEAAARMVAAKSSCLSTEGGVWWPKSLSNPQTSVTQARIRRSYFRAQTG
jgi:hypothetical protein